VCKHTIEYTTYDEAYDAAYDAPLLSANHRALITAAQRLTTQLLTTQHTSCDPTVLTTINAAV
jgi:hypothetical protein